MAPVSTVLLAIAEELAVSAQGEAPKLRNGEMIIREFFVDGVYNRETKLGEEKYLFQYDFRQRKSRYVDVVSKTND